MAKQTVGAVRGDTKMSIEIISCKICDDYVEISYREPSNSQFQTWPPQPVPDKIWKEIYRVVDGKIKLAKTINGRHTPSCTVNESFSYDED
jgi:hypothetical protein